MLPLRGSMGSVVSMSYLFQGWLNINETNMHTWAAFYFVSGDTNHIFLDINRTCRFLPTKATPLEIGITEGIV